MLSLAAGRWWTWLGEAGGSTGEWRTGWRCSAAAAQEEKASRGEYGTKHGGGTGPRTLKLIHEGNYRHGYLKGCLRYG